MDQASLFCVPSILCVRGRRSLTHVLCDLGHIRSQVFIADVS